VTAPRLSAAAETAIRALAPFPMIAPGDDLARAIAGAAATSGVAIAEGDIVVVAQKIVSKAEGRYRRLADVVPDAEAERLAEVTGKDPRLVALILGESRQVLRAKRDVLIVESRLGHIMANAGIDRSNLGPEGDVLLLPEDPDRSARAIRDGLAALTGARPGVIVADSFGRPWRFGTSSVALGVAGPAMVVDLRGEADLSGRALEVSEVGFADTVAAAAGLVMGEGAQGRPVALVRGLAWAESGQTAADGLRPERMDLFR
jgi:coenzyme F420-0:L-glutamate ligase/coenzyme F420-1:gamma-L-glutamate ligase